MRGSNGGWVPQLKRIDRLHVVVTVEQHPRLAVSSPTCHGFAVAGFADYDRMTVGRAHLGGEADGLEISGDVVGSGAAGVLIGGIGRDRLDAQQRE